MGTEHHHPIMSRLKGHRGRLEREGGLLNSWYMVNWDLQDVKKLPRESWISSIKKSNSHPKHHVYFIQWHNHIKPFLQGGDSFKKYTTLTINEKYDLLPSFWKGTEPAEKKAVVEAFESHCVWNVPCILEV